MPFARPTLSELVLRIKGDISARTKGSAFIKRSVERVIAAVSAAVANGLHGHLEWNVRQHLPTTADLDTLLGWGVWLQTPLKGTVAAAGSMSGTGTPGTYVYPTAQAATSDGVVFAAVGYSLVDAGGSYTAPIIAVVAGASGNLDAGTPLTFVSPISGIDTAAVVADGGTTGGSDVEQPEDYRQRILNNLRTPPAGGGSGDYVDWALEVPGVTRAWEFGNRFGQGTVSVSFVMDGRTNIIPTSDDVGDVQAHIDAVRPIDMRACYVQAPTPSYVACTVRVSPNTQDVRDAITTEYHYLFQREASLGKVMTVDKLDEAISTAIGEDHHTITSVSSLDPGPWGILVPYSINFTSF